MAAPPVVLPEPGAPDWRAAAITGEAYMLPDQLRQERERVFAYLGGSALA